MADKFQYVKLPDGSYGKFSADASPDDMRAAVESRFPEAYKPKSGAIPGADTGTPAGLQGGPDPEYKPFFSGDEARDELSGLGKSVTPIVAGAGSVLGKVPGIGKGVIDPQKVQDLKEYSKPANKGETFGKVVGTAAQILPAIYGGGEFGGGLYDEVAPSLGPAISSASSALGKVAGSGAKTLGKAALLTGGGALGTLAAEKLREFLK